LDYDITDDEGAGEEYIDDGKRMRARGQRLMEDGELMEEGRRLVEEGNRLIERGAMIVDGRWYGSCFDP
jgi:hypothetical protein